ncbi:DUF3397 family protein [Liquorilactobacillus cacaonum]|nr:DUF3397 family protein [Liquorilactobacillus cacaonum]
MIWYYQLLLLVVVFLVLVIMKKMAPRNMRKKIKIYNLMVIPVVYCVLVTSLTQLELSIIPFLTFGLGLLGIMMTIVYAYVEGEIIYRVFFKVYFRFFSITVYGLFIPMFLLNIK